MAPGWLQQKLCKEFQTTLLAEQISHSDVVGRFYGEHHVFRELRFVVPLLFLLNLVMGS
jgi:hypothetical protein